MTSMLESTPKPTRATLPASRPAPMATKPSMTFQPTVKYSSHSARRCSARRRSSDRASVMLGGAQQRLQLATAAASVTDDCIGIDR
jgi:hypothetical protein